MGKFKTIALYTLSLVLVFSMTGCQSPAAQNAPSTTEVVSETTMQTSEETTTQIVSETTTTESASETVVADAPLEVRIVMPTGTPALSAVKAIDSLDLEGVIPTFEIVKSPDLMVSKLVSEEIDIAIAPSNLAIKIYNKTGKYQYAGTTIWGTLYIVSDEPADSWAALKGKEIAMIGRGLTPDVITRNIMTANGLVPDEDVTFNYLDGAPDLAAMFISGQSSLSIMPEPVLSKVMTKKEGAHIIFDMQSEWQAIHGGDGGFPQASVMVKSEFAKAHPDVVNKILDRFAESAQWVNDNPQDAGTAYEALNLGIKAPIIAKAIPGANIRFVDSSSSKDALEAYYQVLLDASPELIGGKLPDEGFYYGE